MMFRKLALLMLVVGLFYACQETTSSESSQKNSVAEKPVEKQPSSPTLSALETAHQKAAFYGHAAIQFDLELVFGGKKRLEATITSMTNSAKIKLEKSDGTTLLFDGEKVLQSPDTASYGGARFDIFTWQYFFMAPYKLSDPGAVWKDIKPDTLNELIYKRGKLTFESGIGDAPEDWYVIYKNPQTNLMDVLAYIVTYSKSVEKAEEEPHAVTYEAYEKVAGIPFATKWGFWIWYEDQGLTKKLGEANLSNIKFIGVDDQTFSLDGTTKEVSR